MYLFTSFAALALGLAGVSSAEPSDAAYCASVAQQFSSKGEAPAELAYNCLRSVPLNKTATNQFVKWFNETVLAFQSTTAFIKNPPPSYQKPATDLNAHLTSIKDKINNGTFKSHWDFEVELFYLTQSSHEGHLSSGSVAGRTIRFNPPFAPVAISADGKKLPEIYVKDDIIALSNSKGSLEWTPSPMKTVNGVEAAKFFRDWADRYVRGLIDPHAEWNAMMPGLYQIVPGSGGSSWNSSTMYFGDWMNVTFTNQTVKNRPIIARPVPKYATKLTSMKSGQDYYDLFVRAQNPKFEPLPSANKPTSKSNRMGYDIDGWPAADIIQKNLAQPGDESGGYATGYFLDGVAVFSLHSFGMSGPIATGFQQFCRDFIKKAKDHKAKKVIFDISSNGGGTVFLGIEMFKQFFPGQYPYLGNRNRWHSSLDTLGEASTEHFDELLNTTEVEPLEKVLVTLPYVATGFINPKTNKLYKNWAELAKPYDDNGDKFLPPQLYDFSSNLTQFSMSSGAFMLSGFADYEANATARQPWAVEDMAILTDGYCGSTCSIFTELFKGQMNVTTVAIGGLPQKGPSQIAGSTRGTRVLQADLNQGLVQILGPMLPTEKRAKLLDFSNSGILVMNASFNPWDNIRENETFPQHFAYQAADCRIFWTPATANNVTNLWRHAALAVWGDRSLCVEGSTGMPSSRRPYFSDTCGPAADKGCKQDDKKWGTTGQTYHVNDIPLEAVRNSTKYAQDSEKNASKTGGSASKQAEQTGTAAGKAPGPTSSSDANTKKNAALPLSVGTTSMVLLCGLLGLMFTL